MRSLQILTGMLVLLVCTGCCFAPPQETEVVAQTPAPVRSDVPKPTAALTAEPTQEPTELPTSTPSPTTEPTPAPTPEPITRERLDSGEFDMFYNDTLLIGDSLTEFFSHYILARRENEPDLLGSVKLFGVRGMNVKTACLDDASQSRAYILRGKTVSITELINAFSPKRVFILLGVNDVADRPFETVGGHFAQLIDVIHEKCPDVEVVIQAVLPITKQYCHIQGVTITYYNSFNTVLSEICEEHGAGFLDFSKEMMDDKGYLALPLCSDQLFHLSKKGEAIWVDALRLYAARRMYPEAMVLLSES